MGKGFFNNIFFLALLLILTIMICSSASSAQVDVTSVSGTLATHIIRVRDTYATVSSALTPGFHPLGWVESINPNIYQKIHQDIKGVTALLFRNFLHALDDSGCTVGNSNFTMKYKEALEKFLARFNNNYPASSMSALEALLNVLDPVDIEATVVVDRIFHVFDELPNATIDFNDDNVLNLIDTLADMITDIGSMCGGSRKIGNNDSTP